MRLEGELYLPLLLSQTKTEFPQLPLDINDKDFELDQPKPRHASDALTDMSSAIHLFKLARFNSEIKSVLYCV